MSPVNHSPADAQRTRLIRLAAGTAVALAIFAAIFALLVTSWFQSVQSTLGSAGETGASRGTNMSADAVMAASSQPLTTENRPPYPQSAAEEYVYQGEPGFVPVTAAPLSTLFADVDTAS